MPEETETHAQAGGFANQLIGSDLILATIRVGSAAIPRRAGSHILDRLLELFFPR